MEESIASCSSHENNLAVGVDHSEGISSNNWSCDADGFPVDKEKQPNQIEEVIT